MVVVIKGSAINPKLTQTICGTPLKKLHVILERKCKIIENNANNQERCFCRCPKQDNVKEVMRVVNILVVSKMICKFAT